MKESDIINGIILSLGRKTYPVRELIELCRPFGISEGRLRTWLSRRTKQGFLVKTPGGRTAAYALSEKGRRISSNVALSFRPPDWNEWDGTWWGFAFTVPEEMKKERRRIRTKLESYRFARWYGGFWIRPVRENEKIMERLNGQDHGSLIRFTPMNPFTKEKTDELWDVSALSKEFGRALSDIDESERDIPGYSPEEAHVERIHTGNRIVPLLFKDPLLPPAFLPEGWEGNRLKKRFLEWDERISARAAPFWKSVFENNL